MYQLQQPTKAVKLFEQQAITEIHYYSTKYRVLEQYLPMLQAIGRQARWQLWLSSKPILTRQWIGTMGLDSHKIIQLPNIKPTDMLFLIEKALLSGNFSYILAYTPCLTEEEKQRLNYAAQKGNAHLFIINEFVLHLTHSPQLH